jgi:hypothetical protein
MLALASVLAAGLSCNARQPVFYPDYPPDSTITAVKANVTISACQPVTGVEVSGTGKVTMQEYVSVSVHDHAVVTLADGLRISIGETVDINERSFRGPVSGESQRILVQSDGLVVVEQ